MDLYGETARLPNDHLQFERAIAMFRPACARNPRLGAMRPACKHQREPRKRSKRKWSQSRRGTAAIEFAFVAPVFFLFVFGLIELGRMVMVQQALTNAAREGCRTAVLATTVDSAQVDAAIRDYLESVVGDASNLGKVRVTVPQGLDSTASGTDLTVSVEVDYTDVSWLPMSHLNLTPTIAAQQVGKRE